MLITHSPKGTEDLLPQNSYKWHYVEKKFSEITRLFGYNEIRFPTFEHTELFERGVGDTTDVVQKQMYTFDDKGGRSITLRPEGTASVCRSFLQNNLYTEPMPQKTYYNVPCFRYENKQKGRLREFHQFGVEVFGAKGPSIDAEVINLALAFLKNVGLSDMSVNINSIGCPDCRQKYKEALKDFLKPRFSELCTTCQERFEKNPLRILDCKSPVCCEISKDAPSVLDYICSDCKEHFEGLKKHLEILGIEYKIDTGIVRGLDYYTKTVFEIISGPFTVCGGGRYDGLIEEFGGDSTPGIGFGLGIERLLIRLEELGVEIPNEELIDLYVLPLGEASYEYAYTLVNKLRQNGISADTDHMARGLKPQMKYANKLSCKFVIILGEDEIKNNIVSIKNMATGLQTQISTDKIIDYIKG